MKIMVTGSTGFIGSHAVAALLRGGHEVRVLVRSQKRLARALQMHGLEAKDVEPVEGDITDVGAVKEALGGCDALLHVAAVFSLDPNREAEMARVNPESTDLTLRTGRDLGLDPLVYVSTAGVFVPAPTSTVVADGPVSTGCGPYTRSKVAAEHVARRHAREGAPVVTIYPGAVVGPRDPNEGLSDSMALTRDIIKGRLPALPRPCPLPLVDVRDVAELTRGVMTPARGERHYLLTGHSVDLRDVVATVNRLTGRKLRAWPAPRGLLRATGRLFDWLALRTGKAMPLAMESVDMMLESATRPDVSFDQGPATTDFGLPRTPLEDTLRDSVKWLHEAGHISAAEAGRLA
jgi:nucleoside-diphosphate-sugar epimerase